MCVNLRAIRASFTSIITYSWSEEKSQVAYLDILPVELVEKILSYLDFTSISKLRAVNHKLNVICVRCLNKAFFKIKKDVEDYIFLLYKELNVMGKDFSESIEMYLKMDESQQCNFQVTLKKIWFSSMCFYKLTVSQEKICTFMFYRNPKDDFVFIYGNCIDWAIEKLNYVKKQPVSLDDRDNLSEPISVTSHSIKIISFYRKKTHLSTSDAEYLKYMEINSGLFAESDNFSVSHIASQVRYLLRETDRKFPQTCCSTQWRTITIPVTSIFTRPPLKN